MLIIKKYSNRRLYDTTQSRYITLDELAELIRAGHDIRVVDAKTEEDLTQSVLAQIILDSRGAANLLTPQLMMQLIRMEDDALGEFFGQYLIVALQMYQRVRQSARYYYGARYGRAGGFPPQRQGLGAFNPMGQFMQAMMGGGGWGAQGGFPGQGTPQDFAAQGGPQGPGMPSPQGYDPRDEPPYGYDFDQPPFPPEAYGQDGGYPHFEQPYEPPRHPQQPRQQPPQAQPQPQPQHDPEVARMRAELDELKQLIRQTALGQPPRSGGEDQ